MIIGGAQTIEKLERLVDHPLRTCAGSINLVDDDDRLQTLLQCLQRDKARLRHRTFDRVDQQQHAIDHAEHAFDLAPEVRVAGRVDDIDLRVAVANRAVLREDRNAALALDVVRVHHPLADLTGAREGPGLHKQLVDERRLAVVDVRDDGNVAKVAAGRAHGRSRIISIVAAYVRSRRSKTLDYSLPRADATIKILENP